jgi:aminoglycoside phosphotransferase (APT) family kinase protein
MSEGVTTVRSRLPGTDARKPVDDDSLRHAVQVILSRYHGRRVRIDRLDRLRSPYQTSAALEELDLEFDDGSRLQMVFKDTSREAMSERARRVKPASVHDPRREIETYRQVLKQHDLGTATCYGAVVEEARRRYWLFLEKVSGVELYQVSSLATWQAVAHWLATMHIRFARGSVPAQAREVRALTHDPPFYRLWLERALRFCPDDGASRTARRLAWLARRHDEIVNRLAALPPTFIHGEFYASNVLVERRVGRMRVCPVDWEMAAVGPGLMDLAALTSGNWVDAERAVIAEGYWAAVQAHGVATWRNREDFLADLSCCHIQIAVQWLGWFGRRRAQAGHAQDWLGEALRLTRQLGL